MENLSPDFQRLHITPEFEGDPKSRVGLFYDPTTLLHFSTLDHPDRKIPHPESPARLVSILNQLHDCQLTSKTVIKHHFPPADHDMICLVHDEEYYKLIQDMWTRPGQHSDYTDEDTKYFFDTYHNIHTPLASAIAVSGVVEAVDDLFKDKLDRIFALVRPPGHHAAALMNHPHGFCIYNNVAIAARYAQKTYGAKRILIFDWDAHHGDSSSQVLYDDPSILYISIHRYDEGHFFPGKIGDKHRLGEGKGLGYNLHLAWDIPNKDYLLGDHEYIYALERLFVPIIKDFNPDLTLISAGFDATRGDPLGGLDVTVDGWAYLTKRILELAKGKLILALEGGYNVQAIAEAAESCVRILLNEDMPLVNSLNKKTFNLTKKQCAPNRVGFEAVQEAIGLFRKYWPCLDTDAEGLEMEKIVDDNRNRDTQADDNVASGHAGTIIFKDDKIYKMSKDNEFIFYNMIYGKPNDSGASQYQQSHESLRKFIPKYHGLEEIESKKYLVLENKISELPGSSLVDMKLGKVTYAPDASDAKKKEHMEKTKRTTSENLGFRISGYVIKDVEGKLVRKGTKATSYFELNNEGTANLLKEVLTANGRLNENAVSGITAFLRELVAWFEENKDLSFIGASILLAVESASSNYSISFIDFANVESHERNEVDENVLFGLKSLLNIFESFTA